MVKHSLLISACLTLAIGVSVTDRCPRAAAEQDRPAQGEKPKVDPAVAEVLELNQRLLDSIDRGDWPTYKELCDSKITAFEPESLGQLVQGIAFHHYFFNFGSSKTPRQTTMCSPHVRIMGDAAVVAYTRLSQRLDDAGKPTVAGSYETRIWHRQEGRWKHVHFHRSPLPVK